MLTVTHPMVDREQQAVPNLSHSGTYLLVLELERPLSLCFGGLGRHACRAGHYLYAGSAFGPGGLAGRLRHHVRPVRRPHWHIDYLRAAASVEAIWYIASAVPREHAWAGLLAARLCIPVARFGASDCRCSSHLFFVPSPPDLRTFAELFTAHFPADPVLQAWHAGS